MAETLIPDRLDDARAMWKAVVTMYVAGGLTLLAILPVPEPDPSDHRALAIVAGVLLVVGALMWALGPARIPLKITAIGGTLVVSALVAVAQPLAATPLFYLWPILLAGYHLSRRELVVALAIFYAGFGGALLVSEEPHSKMVLFVGGAASFTLAAIVVNRLRMRLDQVVGQLARAADSDPLTGLMNRRGFEHAFDRDVERAARTGQPLSLVIFDLDHFKQVNDRFGHAAGDEALKDFARVLLDERRGGDPVGRTGGEEFAVVLMDAGLEGAVGYAQRVAAAATLGVSAGVVELGGELQSRTQLMLAADQLLYSAKAAGRGRAAVQGEPPRMERLGTLASVPHVA